MHFFAKLSLLSNNGERIEEQIKQICNAADQIDKYIEMLRGTGLNYTADSMVVILQTLSTVKESYSRFWRIQKNEFCKI